MKNVGRRCFLKFCIAVSAFSFLPVPWKLFKIKERDDTAFVQWHIDNGVSLPGGDYKISNTLKCEGPLLLEPGNFQFKWTGREGKKNE